MDKVYTKTGDKGTTGLFTGERVSKASLRVCAYGTIDEAQAFIGVGRAHAKNEEVKNYLGQVEKELWMLMADVSSLGVKQPTIDEAKVEALEKIIDYFDEKLEPLDHFILPGEHKTASYIHLARTMVRRAERDMWALSEKEEVHDSNVKYLNRLSDLLFTLARAEQEL